jgi:hypothetical protein
VSRGIDVDVPTDQESLDYILQLSAVEAKAPVLLISDDHSKSQVYTQTGEKRELSDYSSEEQANLLVGNMPASVVKRTITKKGGRMIDCYSLKTDQRKQQTPNTSSA